jgi:hypothetical protein
MFSQLEYIDFYPQIYYLRTSEWARTAKAEAFLLSNEQFQLLQHAIAKDKEVRYTFCYDFLSRLEDDEFFTSKIVASDEATFHLSRNVNRHNLRIWGSNNPHEDIEQSKVISAGPLTVSSLNICKM